jgi:lysozyme
VAGTNIKFAFAKATGGQDFVDPRFAENWQGIREANLYRGAYHFFLADDDAQAQAELFVKTIGKLRQNDLPPMLAVETSDNTDLDTLQERVLLWLQLVEKRTRRLPILYTDNGFANRILIDPRFSRYPFWIADYARKVDDLPTPWDKSGWTLWQYGENGRSDGIGGAVDTDEFKGTMEDLLAFIKKSHRQ